MFQTFNGTSTNLSNAVILFFLTSRITPTFIQVSLSCMCVDIEICMYTNPLDNSLITLHLWMYNISSNRASHSFLSKSIICVLLNEMLQTLMWKTSVCNQLTTQNVKISLSSVKILRENLNNLCLNLMFVMVIVFDLDALYIHSYK